MISENRGEQSSFSPVPDQHAVVAAAAVAAWFQRRIGGTLWRIHSFSRRASSTSRRESWSPARFRPRQEGVESKKRMSQAASMRMTEEEEEEEGEEGETVEKSGEMVGELVAEMKEMSLEFFDGRMLELESRERDFAATTKRGGRPHPRHLSLFAAFA